MAGKRAYNFSDMTGLRFGKLSVVRETSPNDTRRRTMWLCKCDCGRETAVRGEHLRRAKITSCGCIRDAKIGALRRSHGLAGTREYRRWSKIKERCLNPDNRSYAKYGGRGITIWSQWRDDFPKFLADISAEIGPCPLGHSLDRKNNERGYEPGNCRWATGREQSRNKRNNIWLELDGKKMILTDWASELGIDNKLLNRVYHDISSEKLEIVRKLLKNKENRNGSS